MRLSKKTWATAAAVVLALAGARVALSQTGGSAPAPARGSAHTDAGYRAHRPAALTERYPEMGVTITPAASSASAQAAGSSLTSGAAALAALQHDRADPFGPITKDNPTESLQTVMERFPVTRGVARGEALSGLGRRGTRTSSRRRRCCRQAHSELPRNSVHGRGHLRLPDRRLERVLPGLLKSDGKCPGAKRLRTQPCARLRTYKT